MSSARFYVLLVVSSSIEYRTQVIDIPQPFILLMKQTCSTRILMVYILKWITKVIYRILASPISSVIATKELNIAVIECYKLTKGLEPALLFLICLISLQNNTNVMISGIQYSKPFINII